MFSTTSTLLSIVFPLMVLLPLATAEFSIYIGSTSDNDRITWKEGQDACMSDFVTLHAGKKNEPAPTCDLAFNMTGQGDDNNKYELKFTGCDPGSQTLNSAKIEVWELENPAKGITGRKVGDCVDGYTGDKDDVDCNWFFDRQSSDIAVQRSCKITL